VLRLVQNQPRPFHQGRGDGSVSTHERCERRQRFGHGARVAVVCDRSRELSEPAGGIEIRQHRQESGAEQAATPLESGLLERHQDRPPPERGAFIFTVGTAKSASYGFDLPERDARASPHVLVGDASAMVDALVERRERWGITYHVISGDDLQRFLPVVTALAS